METKEKFKITTKEFVETVHEVELPCYRLSWCNDEPFLIYKISGTAEKQIVESISFTETAPTYDFNCLSNALKCGNTEVSEMEWLDAIQSVINHLNKEVEKACKIAI